jgi:hypothetical protein
MKVKKHLSFSALRSRMSNIFETIPDWRQQNKITICLHNALMSGFACMHFQDPSLLQFQKRMEEEQHRNNLQTLFSVKEIPKETQMHEIIDGVDSDYLRCTITGKNKAGKEEILYKNSWVTDLLIEETHVNTLVKAGRCRWKSENECFNVMKLHKLLRMQVYGTAMINVLLLKPFFV